MTTLTYVLSREELEAKRIEADKAGYTIVGDSGDLSVKGAQFTFTFVEPTLTLTIVDGGGWPTFIIKNKLNKIFKV